MHPLRRTIALIMSLLALQLTLRGDMPCAGDSTQVGETPGMADMPMGGHDMQPGGPATAPGSDACNGNTSGDCLPTGPGTDCRAMTSCAPGITVGILQLAAADSPSHAGTPNGHLLHALSRATTPEPPPPRG
jgi:hypothetical protein